jgi:hypothetical protein
MKLSKEKIVSFMIGRFPETKEYVRSIEWHDTKGDLFFSLPNAPKELQDKVSLWYQKLRDEV